MFVSSLPQVDDGDGSSCTVLLLHLTYSGVPRSLLAFLEDASVKKVGVNITGDGCKLRTDYNVSLASHKLRVVGVV